MRIITKGLDYTRVETDRTVQFWALKKERKRDKCGVWIDGIKTNNFRGTELRRVKP